MPYIDIHNERVWIPERPLRSMDEARPMRDGDLWRCPACGCELDWEENDDGTITLVCPAHQVGWDAGHEDEPYPMGGLVFRPTVGGGVLIATWGGFRNRVVTMLVASLGFGAFTVGRREASKGRNPSTGAEVDIPARNVPKFTAGKGLKDACNS